MVKRFACLVTGLVLTGVPAHALTVLTADKQAVFRTGSALVRVGGDRALASLVDPTCPSGLASTLQVSAYLQATARVAAGPVIPLQCANWRRTHAGFVYRDKAHRIVYSRDKLQIQLGGTGYAFPGGPVGYVELWLNVGTTRLLTRLHAFRKNDATQLVTRKPSSAAAICSFLS